MCCSLARWSCRLRLRSAPLLISSSTPSSYVVVPPGLMVGLDGGGGHPHAATEYVLYLTSPACAKNKVLTRDMAANFHPVHYPSPSYSVRRYLPSSRRVPYTHTPFSSTLNRGMEYNILQRW